MTAYVVYKMGKLFRTHSLIVIGNHMVILVKTIELGKKNILPIKKFNVELNEFDVK